MPPQRPNLVLASNVPNIEPNVLVCDGLDIETDCGGETQRRKVVSMRRVVGPQRDDTPVGIVVTDWFSFNLYKMAVQCFRDSSGDVCRFTHWSFQLHPDPTSTVSSPYFQRVSLLPLLQPMRPSTLPSVQHSPKALERLAPIAKDCVESKERQEVKGGPAKRSRRGDVNGAEATKPEAINAPGPRTPRPPSPLAKPFSSNARPIVRPENLQRRADRF